MNKQLADSFERDLGISHEQIVREEYEMVILKSLFESKVGRSLIFKGGTALRLAYGSPRFSEDLDFSVTGKLDTEAFDKILKDIAGKNKTLELIETVQKHFTYFAMFKVKEGFLAQPFSIKFEVSIRPADWKAGSDYHLTTLGSRVTNLTVLAQVASLEKIESDKLSINPPRIRDVFDLWFIRRKLGKDLPLDFRGYDTKIIKRDLNKFLPKGDRELLEQWLKK